MTLNVHNMEELIRTGENLTLEFKSDKHGSINRSEAADLCRLTFPQAYHLLSRLKKKGLIQMEGQKRYAVYTRKHEI